MPSFFIQRPVFAWVIAILIILFGAISLRTMGVDSYPNIAPPQVTVTAELSRRQRRDHGIHRHPGHRAATHRHRQPAVFQLDLGLERTNASSH